MKLVLFLLLFVQASFAQEQEFVYLAAHKDYVVPEGKIIQIDVGDHILFELNTDPRDNVLCDELVNIKHSNRQILFSIDALVGPNIYNYALELCDVKAVKKGNPNQPTFYKAMVTDIFTATWDFTDTRNVKMVGNDWTGIAFDQDVHMKTSECLNYIKVKQLSQ